MKEELVIMYPDYNGEGSLGPFGQALATQQFPGWKVTIVAVLNGGSEAELSYVRSEIEKKWREKITTEICLKDGLLATLIHGYGFVCSQYPEAVVVRLDTAEHDTGFIKHLAEIAEKTTGMVVGDLAFNAETLRAGSIDQFVHLQVFPIMTRQFTKDRIDVSCAHGFQAFYPSVLPRILTKAKEIVAAAQGESDSPILTGFDIAMILAADKLRIPVTVELVPARVIRDRPSHKIAAQFGNALRMCRASQQVSRFV